MTRRKNAASLSVCALFAALTGILAQIQLPLPGVPVNMALLAVYLSAMLSGPRRGAWAAAVYLLMGLCGAPVFAGFCGGPAVLFGPTGGFLLGYPLCAVITGRLCAAKNPSFARCAVSGLCGLASCSALGVLWFMHSTGAQMTSSFLCWWLLYLPGDLLKIVLAALLARRLKKPLSRFIA